MPRAGAAGSRHSSSPYPPPKVAPPQLLPSAWAHYAPIDGEQPTSRKHYNALLERKRRRLKREKEVAQLELRLGGGGGGGGGGSGPADAIEGMAEDALDHDGQPTQPPAAAAHHAVPAPRALADATNSPARQV